jgi:hypothetical protein
MRNKNLAHDYRDVGGRAPKVGAFRRRMEQLPKAAKVPGKKEITTESTEHTEKKSLLSCILPPLRGRVRGCSVFLW